jgi:integrase
VWKDHFKPKTHTSEREIPLSPGVLRELETYRPPHGGGFVIASPYDPPPPTGRREYRCRDVFERLVAWLRSKGVTADKPLHEARKEFGSLVTKQAGLFAASRLLGHSGVAITERHYAEWRERVTVDLPALPAPPLTDPVGEPAEEARP